MIVKKLVAVVAVLLCCLSSFIACDNTPYLFYKSRALKIEVECADYSLKLVKDLSGDERYFEITSDNYVETAYLLDSSNDGKEDKEFYNYGGLYAYMSNRKLHVYYNGSLYDIDENYFRKNSKKYNEIEQIWTEKYDVKPSDIPNYVCGAVYFDGTLFILAQNHNTDSEFDKQHPTNLWKLDYLTGAIEFCGFCQFRQGSKTELASSVSSGLAIVKN